MPPTIPIAACRIALAVILANAVAAVEPLDVIDLAGQSHRVVGAASGTDQPRATLLVFLDRDCPIASSYAREIQRIADAYAGRVAPLLVITDATTTVAQAQAYAAEYGYRCALALDPGRQLVRLAGATVTPEAAVIAADGALLYRGRIDDRYVDIGKPRPEATRHDLRDALDAIVAGRPVPTPITTAIGCSIAPLGPTAPADHKDRP